MRWLDGVTDPLDCSLLGSSVWDFFKQDCWSRSPFPSPGDLPDPGIKSTSPAPPALQADSLHTESAGKPRLSHGIESIDNPLCYK